MTQSDELRPIENGTFSQDASPPPQLQYVRPINTTKSISSTIMKKNRSSMEGLLQPVAPKP
jgi:hypothetical protein